MDDFDELALLNPLLNVPSVLQFGFEGMTEVGREKLLRRWTHLYIQKCKTTGLDLDLDDAITALERFVVISTRRAQLEEPLAYMLFHRFEKTQSRPALDRAIGLLKPLYSSTTDSSIRPAQQAVLGDALLSRARLTGSVDDIDCSVILQLFAVIRNPQGQVEWRRGRFDILSAALMMRYEKSGRLENLVGAIMMAKKSLILAPGGHPERWASLNNLGVAMRAMYSKTQSRDVLDSAVKASTEAVALMPASHAGCLSHLGGALWLRFDGYASIDDLDLSISAFEKALACTSYDCASRCNILHDLAVALSGRFQREGTVTDLERAISFEREAIAMTSKQHPKIPDFLNSLGCKLLRQFGRQKSVTILDEAIAMHQQAIDIVSPEHHNYGVYLFHLSTGFQHRGAWTDSMEDFDQAVRASEKALLADCSNRGRYASRLDNLGLALLHRYKRVRSTSDADLDRSIDLLRLATKSELDNPFQQHKYLNNLGCAIQARFNRFRSLNDLNTSINITEEVIKTAPVNCPDYASYLCNLGISLHTRFDRMKSGADLDRGILMIEQAISRTPKGFVKRNDYVNDLISALAARARDKGSVEDIDRAIWMGKDAIGSESHAQLVPFRKILCSTSTALQMRFKLTGILEDLEDAIEAGENAISVTPKEHPDLTESLGNLGNAYFLRYNRTGSVDDLKRSVAAKEQAVGIVNGSPFHRVEIAVSAVTVMMKDHDLPRANRLLQSVVEQLTLVSPRALKRSDQQYNLSQIAGFASLAVSVALECGEDYYSALQLLEIGRGIISNFQLEMRSDISDLRAAHPDLASRFDVIRNRSHRPELEVDESYLEFPGTQQRIIGKDLEDVLYTIRQQPGFDRFLLGLSQLEWEALPKGGTIVVFNVSKRRSDAFIVHNGEIRCLQLCSLTPTELIRHANRFTEAIDLMSKNYREGYLKMKEVLEWLWDTITSPILDSLGFTQSPHETEVWPRVWWIGSGLLSILPIHAAGYHASTSKRTVLDRVISSYASTGKSLAYAWERYSRVTTSEPEKVLLVAMPQTPQHRSLPNVKVEIDGLKRILNSSPTVLSNPTSQDVLDAMAHHHVLHLACHGSSAKDPSQSKLLLSDWKSNPLTVTKIMSLNLHTQSLQFAFLSACETARMLDQSLFDESIHLASAFQLAGYPSVVASLWLIADRPSSIVAQDLYRWMLKDGRLDSGRSAEALHRAVRLLRDTSDDPLLWASYIHLGV